MEKPPSFTTRHLKKYGRQEVNDYAQPQKFFADMVDFYKLIDGIPFVAVEELEKYELNREIVIKVIRRLFKICDAAKINIIQEIDNMDKTPFDDLELARDRTRE